MNDITITTVIVTLLKLIDLMIIIRIMNCQNALFLLASSALDKLLLFNPFWLKVVSILIIASARLLKAICTFLGSPLKVMVAFCTNKKVIKVIILHHLGRQGFGNCLTYIQI
jgi:hypothetical protein